MDYFLVIKATLDYIENRVTEELPLPQVAEAAGFSLPHFRKIFAASTGQSIGRYIQHRRLNHAALELRRSESSVLEVAMQYGFNSHDTFTRAFRGLFGEAPSEFRKHQRTVSSTLITQGIYGPKAAQLPERMIQLSEAHTVQTDSAVLYGVPRISYAGPAYEVTPFLSALRACLEFMGQAVSYQQLMATSGAAFRLLWNGSNWDGGNVDVLAFTPDPIEPIRRALNSVGRSFTLLCKPAYAAHLSAGQTHRLLTGDKQDFIDLVKQSIDAGRPLIGLGIVGPPEACVITGYRDNGETLLGWSYFQEMPEYQASVRQEPCGYFARAGWFEHPDTLALVSIGGLSTLPDEPALLSDTLQFALRVMQTENVRGRSAGQRALTSWANALLDNANFPAGAPLPLLMERLMCQVDAATVIGERSRAAAFLQEKAALFPQAEHALLQAAALFNQEYALAERMPEELGGSAMSEKQALALAERAVRERLAAIIGRAKQLEKQAATYLRSALDDIRKG